VQVPETKGEHVVEGPELESPVYTQLINTQKVNASMIENPNFTQIGYYWSDATV
jgi:hypothetical protein